MADSLRNLNPEAPIVMTRRNLPHWFQEGCSVFVTFRLADSLPEELLGPWREEWKNWRDAHPQPWSTETWREYDQTFTQQINDWLDAGRGECWLRRAEVRAEVVHCLHAFDGDRLALGDYVLMPNHVHLLITPKIGFSLAKLLKGIKGTSARRCNQLLARTGAFWMEESYDHLVRNRAQWEAFKRYIANNPIKAGLSAGEFTHYQEQGGGGEGITS